MSTVRKDAAALVGTLAIILAAFFLLSYGRKHEVAAILMFGHTLDALVTAGIIGNLIVFLLVKITQHRSLRIALWTLLTVNVLLLLIAESASRRVDPNFRSANLIAGYALSFIFWFSLHWLWARSSRRPACAPNKN